VIRPSNDSSSYEMSIVVSAFEGEQKYGYLRNIFK